MPTSVAETPEHARRAERLLNALERVEIAMLKLKPRKGKRARARKLHVPPRVDVKAVRERTGLTQEEFAATFAIGLGALRHWERGDRKPRGTALVLLNVIAKDPRAVLRAVEKP